MAVCTHVSFVLECVHTRLICVRVCAHTFCSQSQPSLQERNTLKNNFDEIFSVVEALYQSGCVMGVANKFFDLVEDSAAFRPVSTMLRVECVTCVRVHACGVRVHGVC